MEKEKNKKRIDIKRAAKKVGHAAAGAGLAVSLFFGSLFSSPAEIIEPGEVQTPTAGVIQTAPPPEEPADFCLDTELFYITADIAVHSRFLLVCSSRKNVKLDNHEVIALKIWKYKIIF